VVGDTTGVLTHDNGAPYQLGGGEWQSDAPADGLVRVSSVLRADSGKG